jgi:hypothetical protein
VIDWYNYIVQHNPTPNGFKTGKGNAYETPLRDQTHGRIYRIVSDSGTKSPWVQLIGASEEKRVETLKNNNLLWRMMAQRLLVERNQQDVVPDLLGLLANQTVDEIGLNAAAIHALWALKGIGAMKDPNPKVSATLKAALDHPSAAVRRAAVTVLPREDWWAEEILRHRLLADPDAQVRLATMLTISEMPANPKIALALTVGFQATNNFTDRWVRDAMTCAGAANATEFLSAVIKASGHELIAMGMEQGTIVQRIAGHLASGNQRQNLVSLLTKVGNDSGAILPILDGVMAGWPKNEKPVLETQDVSKLKAVLGQVPENAQGPLLSLFNDGVWGNYLPMHSHKAPRSCAKNWRIFL